MAELIVRRRFAAAEKATVERRALDEGAGRVRLDAARFDDPELIVTITVRLYVGADLVETHRMTTKGGNRDSKGGLPWIGIANGRRVGSPPRLQEFTHFEVEMQAGKAAAELGLTLEPKDVDRARSDQ